MKLKRSKVDQEVVHALVEGRHADPHQILGLHNNVVSVWRPDAQKVAVWAEGKTVEADRHESGLFTAEMPEGTKRYKLSVTFFDGTEIEAEDPYRFLPTLGELDLHLITEGRHLRLWEVLGANIRTIDGVTGTSFAVWAPNARAISIVGGWNAWQTTVHPMRSLGPSGVWELFVPGIGAGEHYKFRVIGADGTVQDKADPLARAAELAPRTASIVNTSDYVWQDAAWVAANRTLEAPPLTKPMSIYEVHMGSWRQIVDDSGIRPFTYAELAAQLPAYVKKLGFTHVEFLPVAEHPYAPSWGYQVTGYYAPSSRFGTPDQFRALVDALHAEGIGVLVDWVPAHFPKDIWALAKFDGTALYEHADPRLGEQPDWGTLVFNFGRNEVRNFLIANALYWLEEFHLDGLRVDAVASMLYLDYSRKAGEWLPNRYGGRENLEAIEFLQQLSAVVHAEFPSVALIAEESTAWPGVSRPTWLGGLGFGFKWNMGWMHDTLSYFSRDPAFRKFHHHEITFGLLYAWHENFVLPLSHDEVVHGKGSLLNKMPGDRWQQHANLRALYGWMWAHPGKKLLFAGCEIGQDREWDASSSIDWHMLQWDQHKGVQTLVGDLNEAYKARSELWSVDFDEAGFYWIRNDDADANVIAFARRDPDADTTLVCVANLSPVVREDYLLGLPFAGEWKEALNTDSAIYSGSNIGNAGVVVADKGAINGQPHGASIKIGPLSVIWLVPNA